MKYLFLLGHPAQFQMFKPVIAALKREHEVFILCKTKEMLETLLKSTNWKYLNISPKRRKNTRAAMALRLLKCDLRMLRFCRRYKPNLLVGSSPEITHVGNLLRLPSIVMNEDDVDVSPLLARAAFPFASAILSPTSCNLGRWEHKSTKYNGYQKLAYLHPNRFSPDREKVAHLYGGRERYFILRLVKLTAHHDAGVSGISNKVAECLNKTLEPHGRVWISAERPLPPSLQLHRLELDPVDIHHALFHANLFIGDSQSMTMEAALLGTPAVRVSDFVGRIGVLEELEHTYNLTIGVRPADTDRLFGIVNDLLNRSDLQSEWKQRRAQVIAEKIDVSAFFVWFISNYPESAAVVRDDPDYPTRFK